MRILHQQVQPVMAVSCRHQTVQGTEVLFLDINIRNRTVSSVRIMLHLVKKAFQKLFPFRQATCPPFDTDCTSLCQNHDIVNDRML